MRSRRKIADPQREVVDTELSRDEKYHAQGRQHSARLGPRKLAARDVELAGQSRLRDPPAAAQAAEHGTEAARKRFPCGLRLVDGQR